MIDRRILFATSRHKKAVSQIAKSSKAVQKGTKYAKRAKTAVSSAKAVKKAKTAASTAKTVGKKVLNKSSSALKKRVKLNGGKLGTRTGVSKPSLKLLDECNIIVTIHY